MIDWRQLTSDFDRIDARLSLKNGPYRLMHRNECCCTGCCGTQLAQEIQEFYETRPVSVTDSTKFF